MNYILTPTPSPAYPTSWLVLVLPKGSSVRLYNCDLCGATVSDRLLHTAWHKDNGA